MGSEEGAVFGEPSFLFLLVMDDSLSLNNQRTASLHQPSCFGPALVVWRYLLRCLERLVALR